MKILFSVILPVYNAEKTIENAIKSVLNDNNSNVELVIINDGSTDKSESIINKYINDPRISYYYQKNSGVSAARNYGLSVAKGEYVAFLDSDDFFSQDAFVKLTEYVNKYDSDIIGFGFYSEYFDKNNTLKQTNANTISCTLDFDVSTASSQLKYVFSSSKILLQTSWNKVFKRKIITDNDFKFDINLVCYENLTLIFDIMSVCKKITFVPDILYYYCSYEQNSDILIKRRKVELTSNVSVCMKNFIKIADKYNYTADFRYFMYEQFFKDFTYCSKKIFMSHNDISKSERLKLFSDFLNDEMFLYLKDNYFGGYTFYKIIYILHKNKMDFLAYKLYKKKIL